VRGSFKESFLYIHVGRGVARPQTIVKGLP